MWRISDMWRILHFLLYKIIIASSLTQKCASLLRFLKKKYSHHLLYYFMQCLWKIARNYKVKQINIKVMSIETYTY